MLEVVGLREDIVAAVLDATGVVVPVGTLVLGLPIRTDPDVWRGCDEHVWCDASNGPWTLVSDPEEAIADVS